MQGTTIGYVKGDTRSLDYKQVPNAQQIVSCRPKAPTWERKAIKLGSGPHSTTVG